MSRLALRPPGAQAWLVVLVLAAAAITVLPAVLGDAAIGEVTLATTRAAMAAAAAVALAAGRPSLGVAALGGVGAYASGLLAIRGWGVPQAILAGIALAALSSTVLGLLGSRLSAAAFAAFTLVVALAGGALVGAVPDTFGGSGGLQPVPQLQLPLRGGDVLTFNATGTLHIVLTFCAAAVVAIGLVLLALPGARWRAIGGDRERSAAAGLRPLRGELAALAVAGAVAGLGGALGVHAAGVASPSAFSADAAVVPLLAALLAGRGGPALAALIGGVTAALGLEVLPALGWSGPPSADALATGLLAAATLVALPAILRRGGPRGEGADVPAPPADAMWPAIEPEGGPAGLRVAGLDVVPARRMATLARLDLDVPAGAIHGLAGPNGAGKSTALGAIVVEAQHGERGVRPVGAGQSTASGAIVVEAQRRDKAVRLVGAGRGARAVLLPQAGGGWPGTTVEETLRLAARAGHRSRHDARRSAAQWLSRLALVGVSNAPCEALSHGVRRRVELARVLLLRPAVLLCDEPLAGLGEPDRAVVLACLRAAAAGGVTVIVAEHDRASLARLATHTVELRPLDDVGSVSPTAEPAPG